MKTHTTINYRVKSQTAPHHTDCPSYIHIYIYTHRYLWDNYDRLYIRKYNGGVLLNGIEGDEDDVDHGNGDLLRDVPKRK